MATGGGGASGGGGGPPSHLHSSSPSHTPASAGNYQHHTPHHYNFRIRPDELVHGFLSRFHSYLPPIPRRRTHSTSSSTSTLSHTSSLGLMEAVSRAQGTPTSPRHSMRGLSSSSQYGLRGSVMHRNSLGDSSSSYPSPMLPSAAASSSAAAAASPFHSFGGGMSSGNSTPFHTGARSVASLPMDSSTSSASFHPPTGRRMSAPLALSPQHNAAASTLAAEAGYGSRTGELRRRDHYQNNSRWASAADRLSPAAVDPTGEISHRHTSSIDGSKPSPMEGSRDARTGVSGPQAAYSSLAKDDGYDASSENLAAACKPKSCSRPDKERGDRDRDRDKEGGGKSKYQGLKDTLRRRKGKPDAKRRDGGGLSDIAPSAATSQCTTPVPLPTGDDDEDPVATRKVSSQCVLPHVLVCCGNHCGKRGGSRWCSIKTSVALHKYSTL